MTTEPPDRAGRPRSEAASRLAALLAEIEMSGEASASRPAGPPPVSALVDVEPGGNELLDGPRPSPVGLGADGSPAPALDHPADPDPTIAGDSGERDGAAGPGPAGPAAAVRAEAPLAPATTVPTYRGGQRAVGPATPDGSPTPATSEVARPAATVIGARRVAAVPDEVQSLVAAAAANSAELDRVARGGRRARRLEARPRPKRWRSVVFGVTVALLALTVPTLGYMGSQALLHSHGGTVQAQENDPHAAGYLGIVTPTQTALMVQRDTSGAPVALTLLALGHGDSGGTVLFIPMDTLLQHPALEIDRLRTVYNRAGNPTFLAQVATLLNVAFTAVVNVTDADLAKEVAPVAPLSIQNPVAVTGEGMTFPAGPLELQKDQIGPYLNAVAPGQDDLDRMGRHQLVWSAWLHAIAASKQKGAVPNFGIGLGPYLVTLARGQASLATLAVNPVAQLSPDGAHTFAVDPPAMQTQITDAVPAPESPGFGSRFSIEVLNGVNGNALPSAITRLLVYDGGEVNTLGNAAKFGVTETTIEYHDQSPLMLMRAKSAEFVLGGGRLVYNPSSDATVDLVITIGSDVLSKITASGSGSGGSGG